MIRRLTAVLFTVAAVLAACAPRTGEPASGELGARGTIAPVFAIDDSSTGVTRFDPPGTGSLVTLEVGYSVSNANPFDLMIDVLEYSATIEGRPVGSGTRVVGVTIGAGETAELVFNLQASLGGNPDLLRAVARSFSGRPLDVKLEGRARFLSDAQGSSGHTNFTLRGAARATEEVRAPDIGFNSVVSGAFMLRPGMPVVRVVLIASNPGDIGYFLHSKDLRLVSDGTVLATQDLLPTPIAAHSQGRLELLFYPQQAGLDASQLRVLSDLLGTGQQHVTVEGDLFMDVLGVDTFAVPGGLRASGELRGN